MCGLALTAERFPTALEYDRLTDHTVIPFHHLLSNLFESSSVVFEEWSISKNISGNGNNPVLDDFTVEVIEGTNKYFNLLQK
jgi:hypothetical protein